MKRILYKRLLGHPENFSASRYSLARTLYQPLDFFTTNQSAAEFEIREQTSSEFLNRLYFDLEWEVSRAKRYKDLTR